MRRRLVICAVTLAVVAAFALARKHVRVAHAATNPGNLSLTGIPVVRGCQIGPAFTFCNRVPGTLSQQVQFQVTTSSDVTNIAVSIAAIPGLASNFAPGDFTLVNPLPPVTPCAGNLAKNQFCEIFIDFSPTISGLRAAVVTVIDSEGDRLAFNIEGSGSNLAVSPPALPPACPDNVDNAYVFCPQPVGGQSPTASFGLISANSVTGLTIALAAIPGLESEFNALQPDFTIQNSTTCGGSLGALLSCTIDVTFTPKTAGLRAAALTASDAQGDSVTVYVAGHTTTGVVIEAGGPFLTCMATVGPQFCNEPSGGVSAARPLSIVNISGTAITGVVLPKGSTTPNANTPPDFTVQNTTCSATLAAAASCQINVQFTPQSTGLRQGIISVTDAQGDIAGLNLAGFGDDYELGLASGQLAEVGVAAGNAATFKLQVNPDSVFGMNGEHVMFVCPDNLPHNTSCTVTPCPASVTVAAPAAFQAVLVTSNLIAAPKPPAGSGCASYSTAEIVAPGMRGPKLQPPAPAGRPAPIFIATLLAAMLLAMAVVWGVGMTRPLGLPRRPRGLRLRLGFVAVGIVFSAIAGCGGKTQPVLPMTPAGTTNMNVIGQALDANGNPINAARSVQIILSVTSQ